MCIQSAAEASSNSDGTFILPQGLIKDDVALVKDMLHGGACTSGTVAPVAVVGMDKKTGIGRLRGPRDNTGNGNKNAVVKASEEKTVIKVYAAVFPV